MKISGKTVAFLGDSITEGAGTSAVENRFTDVFSKLAKVKSLNYGIGGTRIARQTTECAPYKDFIARTDEMSPDADIVV
ncbi:MAG: hypothetical protein ACI4GX_05830, partial [Ruminococcus sp.]